MERFFNEGYCGVTTIQDAFERYAEDYGIGSLLYKEPEKMLSKQGIVNLLKKKLL